MARPTRRAGRSRTACASTPRRPAITARTSTAASATRKPPSCSRIFSNNGGELFHQRRHALLYLRLHRLGGAQNRAGVEEIEQTKRGQLRPDQNVRRAALELLGDDRVAHQLERREQVFP